MPATLIRQVNGVWKAFVANTEISYTFTGNTAQAQLNSVENLANAMKAGEDDVIQELPNVFSDIPPGESSFMVSENLFGLTDTLTFNQLSYVVTTGEDILEEIEPAGEWLLTCL